MQKFTAKYLQLIQEYIKKILHHNQAGFFLRIQSRFNTASMYPDIT